jgi:NADPH-dependent ferric siderophore reductase
MSDMRHAFRATAQITLPHPGDTMRALCSRFEEFGTVSGHGRCRRIEIGFGTADIKDCGRCLEICAAGHDEVALAYMKLSMAEHLLSLAHATPSIVWQGDGMAGAPLPYFREMQVKQVRDLTPRMRRITLSGPDLARFAAGGMHVRLLLPRDRHAPPQWPVMGEDGRPCWPSGEQRPDVRMYTLRRVDPEAGEVDIDFVLHDGNAMPGARFAAEAMPGDRIGMTGPGGGEIPRADWLLLLGDETALPAIARILESLPAASHAVVRIEVGNRDERQPLVCRGSVDLKWLYREGAATGNLLSAELADIEWPDDERSVFAWAGCEFSDFAAIRRHFRKELGLPRDKHLVVAYWRRGFAGEETRETE